MRLAFGHRSGQGHADGETLGDGEVPADAAQCERFFRRYLQHVLPSGFQKVRHYGFLNGNCAIPFLLIRWLVAIANERVMELCRTDVIVAPWVPSLKCPACGGVLICREILLPNGMRFDVRPPPEIRARGSPVQGGLA